MNLVQVWSQQYGFKYSLWFGPRFGLRFGLGFRLGLVSGWSVVWSLIGLSFGLSWSRFILVGLYIASGLSSEFCKPMDRQTQDSYKDIGASKNSNTELK